MYKFMLIILSFVVTIFSSSCAPYPVVATTPVNKISEKVGLPFGTVITLGGKKMVVISQENEEVRLQLFKPVIVKAVIPKVKVTEIISDLPTPEWESKTVITEGVKNVQECLNPMGCPQDTKTGECLKGCTEQKVRVEIIETIVDSTNVITNEIIDPDVVLNALLLIDPTNGSWKNHHSPHYGKITWICVLANNIGFPKSVIALSKLIYNIPGLLDKCNRAFAHNSLANSWTNESTLSSL
jgi:hypothetical protein